MADDQTITSGQSSHARRQIVVGMTAHVDAGKTTLSEALLYLGGTVRTLGRVDNGNAFLDTSRLEKARGITIFTHQALVHTPHTDITLLDTPGHIDFSAQTERTLAVLDCAILVVSASDGVEGTTRFLWKMLSDFHLPVFIFVNKIDTPGFDRARLMKQLQSLTSACVDFSSGDSQNDDASLGDLPESTLESIAVRDDQLLNNYLQNGASAIGSEQMRDLIARRQLVPCFFGSALKIQGVSRLLTALQEYAPTRPLRKDFGARVIRISHDSRSQRLTWVRVTGGELMAKQEIGEQEDDSQKADELRIYDGSKYETVPRVAAGQVCTIVGPRNTYPGQGLGAEPDNATTKLQPVLVYRAVPVDTDGNPESGDQTDRLLHALQMLDDEDPLLNVTWNTETNEIDLRVMGEIQLETISDELHDRFHLSARFDDAGVVYAETITQPIEGVGHFEPLRHYAEVHLLLQPAARGEGLHFADHCPPDTLESKWRRDILAFLGQKTHRGVLIGAPLTDVKITLLAGKANITHTVGGDFRQATWRAVRQGLMELRDQHACQILEPWYRFQLEIPVDQVGRAYSDIDRMGGSVASTDTSGEISATVSGNAPVSRMRGYAREVRNYTHGQGRLFCMFDSFRPCTNQDQLISTSAYDPMAHPEDTPDSVFCAHGAGYTVDWKDVPTHMHMPYQWGNPRKS
jgi:ribosomal protection tetracycline resistance protein